MNKRFGIVGLIILIGLIVFVCCVFLNKEKTIEIEATIMVVRDGEIVVLDDNGVEYLLKVDGTYNVGDRIDFVMKNVNENSNPIEGDVVVIDIISKNINFSITDDDNVSDNSGSVSGDEAVVNYLVSLNDDLDNYENNKSLGDKVKNGFVTIIDFLFYGGKIHDITFEELGTSVKLEVLKLAFSIDVKIEKYFPGYKESIASGGKKIYTNIKIKVLELYMTITTQICDNDPKICEEAKKGLKELKDSFKLTWDFFKDASSKGLDELRKWYEIWREA